LVFIITLLVSCQEKKEPENAGDVLISKHLVESNSSLLQNKDTGIKIIDFRKPDQFEKGHISGAINLWRTDIQDTSFSYGGIRAKKDVLETRLGNLGITNDDTLVVYDNRGSADASRLWWLLKLYNFDKVYLLNGGYSSWERMGGGITLDNPEIKPAEFSLPATNNAQLVIEREDLLRRLNSGNSNVFLVDARTADEHHGKTIKDGARRGGHIPSSIHIDWAEAVDYGHTYRFKPIPELENIYSRIGASKEDTIIVYCHTGVRSAHTTFVLTQLLDYKNVLNYDGSWVEWSYFVDSPIEKNLKSPVKK